MKEEEGPVGLISLKPKKVKTTYLGAQVNKSLLSVGRQKYCKIAFDGPTSLGENG